MLLCRNIENFTFRIFILISWLFLKFITLKADMLIQGGNITIKEIPECLRTESEIIEKKEDMTMVVDGMTTTCKQMELNQNEINLISYLGRDYNITYVDIYIKEASHQSVSVEVEVIKGFPITQIKEINFCFLESRLSKGNTLEVRRFRCNPSVNAIIGDGIRLKLKSLQRILFTLCEITAFSLPDRRCGSPEKKLQCHSFEKFYQKAVEYRPMDLNSIQNGNVIRYCNNGKWTGETPKCSSEHLQECSTPECPANGKLSLAQALYSNNQELTIKCDEGYILDGPNINTCKNGSWDSITRFCDKNLMYKHHIWNWYSDQESFDCLQEFTDGNTSTCAIYHSLQKPSTLLINLTRNYNIGALVLTMRPLQINSKNTVLKITIEIGNISPSLTTFELCKTLEVNTGNWTVNSMKVLCGKQPISGNSVRIRFNSDSKRPLYMNLCEVEIQVNPRKGIFRRICHNPEIRPNCLTREIIDSNGNQYLYYYPKPHYQLIGKRIRPCRNKRWLFPHPSCVSRDKNFSRINDDIRRSFIKKETPYVIISIFFISACIISTIVFNVLTWDYAKKRMKLKSKWENLSLDPVKLQSETRYKEYSEHFQCIVTRSKDGKISY